MSEDVAQFRLEARGWLAANMTRCEDAPPVATQDEDYTEEYLGDQRALQRRLFDGGFAGITWPKEYGGRGLTLEFQNAFDEEARDYRLPDFGKPAVLTFEICGPTFLVAASEDFKQRHIPKILSGEELWAQFFSEPSAGSDLAAAKTTAVRDGDGWRLNGSKIWSSFAHRCDFGFCLARTDPTLPKHQGLTWFAVPTDAPGLTVRPFRMIDGTNAFCEEFFEDVWIPDSERIGEVNEGWSVTHKMLVFERDFDGIARRAQLGPGPLAPDLVALARSVGTSDDASTRDLLATAHINDYVIQQLYARIEDCLEGDVSASGTPAFGKLARGTFDPIRGRIAMEIASGAAIAWTGDAPEGRRASTSYLNGRVFSIAAGTNEMQRNAIAERAHGLPRER